MIQLTNTYTNTDTATNIATDTDAIRYVGMGLRLESTSKINTL